MSIPRDFEPVSPNIGLRVTELAHRGSRWLAQRAVLLRSYLEHLIPTNAGPFRGISSERLAIRHFKAWLDCQNEFTKWSVSPYVPFIFRVYTDRGAEWALLKVLTNQARRKP